MVSFYSNGRFFLFSLDWGGRKIKKVGGYLILFKIPFLSPFDKNFIPGVWTVYPKYEGPTSNFTFMFTFFLLPYREISISQPLAQERFFRLSTGFCTGFYQKSSYLVKIGSKTRTGFSLDFVLDNWWIFVKHKIY